MVKFKFKKRVKGYTRKGHGVKGHHVKEHHIKGQKNLIKETFLKICVGGTPPRCDRFI